MKIIRIGAIWCPACLIMNKIWNKINMEYKLDITNLDYDMDSDQVSKYNVGKILPVVIFTDKNNVELERIVGETKEDIIINVIMKYMVI